MRLAARFIVRFGYYYALALGFVNFRYDRDSGRVRPSTALSAYSLAICLLLTATLPLQLQFNVGNYVTSKARHFLRLLVLTIAGLRTVGMILTLLANWLKRHEISAIITDFQRLHRQHFAHLQSQPATQLRFERSLVRKFLLTCVNDALRWFLIIGGGRYGRWYVNSAMGLVMNAMSLMYNLMYFSSHCLGWYYDLFNDELQRVLRATRATSHLRGWHEAAFRRRSAQLADQLDQLLTVRRQLRALTRRINAVAQVQSLVMMLHLYFYNIIAIYMIYSLQKPNGFRELGMTLGVTVYSVLMNIGFYADVREFLATHLRLLQASQAGVRLLRQQLHLESLDVRLERSMEQFCLLDASDPLEIPMMGLFNFNGASVFAAFGATFGHAIVLIQYDFKNF